MCADRCAEKLSRCLQQLLLLLLLQVTHLFKDVLHGHGRFVMVVNVNPAADEFNETKRVLQVGWHHFNYVY
jgi:hypothetical protein